MLDVAMCCFVDLSFCCGFACCGCSLCGVVVRCCLLLYAGVVCFCRMLLLYDARGVWSFVVWCLLADAVCGSLLIVV